MTYGPVNNNYQKHILKRMHKQMIGVTSFKQHNFIYFQYFQYCKLE
jgi:hypothetical protein